MLRRVLIANRGEIAVRIIRGCREMGIESVAVFSDADRRSPHVLLADHAVRIGPPPSVDSYLRADRLVEAALATGADAIHPGYGFLAERAEFARLVTEAGLVFVGPEAGTIAAMGDKTEARRRMRAAGVPIVPGAVDAVASPEEAETIADELGFPVLLKAAAGGGGKGMRVVTEPGGLARAFEGARREAEAAFGDGSIYVERYLDRPRHIEIQVLGDRHGTIVHLGERECSIQRRHQKLVEEAPSPVLSAEERERMGRAAVAAAAAVDYVGAGTIEFLYQDGEFYFLEMNTRLQVEHPVTECVTGIDLVEWQLRVAAGEPLAFTQEDIRLVGHAIECRITSEDVAAGFLPATGVVRTLGIPQGAGVRWDGGIGEGFAVGLHYDPLLGKLIVHGADRNQAIARMRRALGELLIEGVATSVPFHTAVMVEPDFMRGDLTIRYVEEHEQTLVGTLEPERAANLAVAIALLEHDARNRARGPRRGPDGAGFSAWRQAALPVQPTGRPWPRRP